MRAHILALLLIAGCDSDRDNDGLTNAEEREYGTGSAIADTDGDGLLDGAEVHEHGTDPLKIDGDGDGFDDGVEVEAQTDANDPYVYPRDDKGTWPDLSDWAPDDVTTGYALNDVVPAFTAVDQFGQTVSSYQFYGLVTVVRLSAGSYCTDCTALASTDQATLDVDWDKGLVILHLLVDDDVRDGTIEDDAFVASYASTHGLQLPVLRDKSLALPAGLYEEGLYTGQIPLTVVLDRQMQLNSVHEGKAGADNAKSVISALLSTPFPGE